MLRFTKLNPDATMTASEFNNMLFQPALRKIESKGVALYGEEELDAEWKAYKLEQMTGLSTIIKWYVGRPASIAKLNKFNTATIERLVELLCPEELADSIC